MKIINKFMWALLPLMSVALLAACEEDPTEPNTNDPNAPAITLEKSVLEVAASAGDYTVTYTLTNAIDGEVISATSSADWVTTDTATAGIIKVSVTSNSGDTREATIEVSYKGAQNKQIKVKQADAGEIPTITNEYFHVELSRADYREYYINVYPKDAETAYICMSASPDYIEENDLQEDMALFMDDMLFFDALGTWNKVTIDDVLNARAKYGNQMNIKVGDGCPDSENIFYCYHVNIDTKELASPITRLTVRTKAQELTEQKFEVKMSIDGPFVNIEEIYPKGTYSGYYYFDLFPKVVIDESGKTPEKYVEEYFNYMASNELAHMMTPSASEILSERCSMGKNSYYVHLLANTEYYLASFAVNDLAICASVPQIDIITTGGVEPSDMKIDIKVTNVGPYGATISTTPDIPDYYVTGYAETEYYESMGKTDEERRDYLISHFSFDYINYPNTDNLIKLTPETNYTAFAFGAKGGVPTTELFRKDFTTVTSEPTDITIALKPLGYFDADEVMAANSNFSFLSRYSGGVVLPIDVVVEPEGASSTFYWEVYVGDPYDEANYISGLLYQGTRPQRAYYGNMEYGTTYTFVAIVVDEETGQYSNLVKESITTTKEGANDPQVFIDWYNNMQGTSVAPASIVINDNAETKNFVQNLTRTNAQNLRKVEDNTRERYSEMETPAVPTRLTIK